MSLERPEATWMDPRAHVGAVLGQDWYRGLARLQSLLVGATFDFFRPLGILPALAPVTTGAISSPMSPASDSLPVGVNVLGEDTYLADSMQFQLEALVRISGNGSFYVMPTFRGEEADARHLNQFFHAEAEIAGSLVDVQELVGRYVQGLAQVLLGEGRDDLTRVLIDSGSHLEALRSMSSIPVVSVADAHRILNGNQFWSQGAHGLTVSDAGEKELVERIGGEAVWLERPPVMTVPFYQRSDDGETALAADLLMRGVGEVAGCGERWADQAGLVESMRAHGVSDSGYEWYVAMKRLRPLSTSGFGLGLERFLQWALKCPDIRELQIFPRLRGFPTGI